MKVLISKVRVCDNESAFHGKSCDILIQDGIIESIVPAGKATLAKGTRLIEAKGSLLFPGLADMRADFCDPGFEYKEDLASGARAALAGGFTDVALLPTTQPVRHSKIGVEYVRQSKQPINLHAYGSLSVGMEGKEMAELYDMHQTGAIGFTDGFKPVSHAGILLRALLYCKIFDGLCLVWPNDNHISCSGIMHEGNVSTLLGLKGIPSIAEEIMVNRDLEILKYTGGKLHFSAISTKGSVDLIRKARKQGLKVTADVAFANLCFTDESLMEYDSNFKVYPPLRSKQDQKALWEGIQDGTIGAIVSNHQPQNPENKEVEFEYALPGMNTLEVMLTHLLSCKPQDIDTETVIRALSSGPRGILQLPKISVETGANASLTLYNPELSWTFSKPFSKAVNSPFLNKTLRGKVTHVFHQKQIYSF